MYSLINSVLYLKIINVYRHVSYCDIKTPDISITVHLVVNLKY